MKYQFNIAGAAHQWHADKTDTYDGPFPGALHMMRDAYQAELTDYLRDDSRVSMILYGSTSDDVYAVGNDGDTITSLLNATENAHISAEAEAEAAHTKFEAAMMADLLAGQQTEGRRALQVWDAITDIEADPLAALKAHDLPVFEVDINTDVRRQQDEYRAEIEALSPVSVVELKVAFDQILADVKAHAEKEADGLARLLADVDAVPADAFARITAALCSTRIQDGDEAFAVMLEADESAPKGTETDADLVNTCVESVLDWFESEDYDLWHMEQRLCSCCEDDYSEDGTIDALIGLRVQARTKAWEASRPSFA